MNAQDDSREIQGILEKLLLLAQRRAAHERGRDVVTHFVDLWSELDTAADDFCTALPASPTEH